jgi:hypothetical protein
MDTEVISHPEPAMRAPVSTTAPAEVAAGVAAAGVAASLASRTS